MADYTDAEVKILDENGEDRRAFAVAFMHAGGGEVIDRIGDLAAAVEARVSEYGGEVSSREVAEDLFCFVQSVGHASRGDVTGTIASQTGAHIARTLREVDAKPIDQVGVLSRDSAVAFMRAGQGEVIGKIRALGGAVEARVSEYGGGVPGDEGVARVLLQFVESVGRVSRGDVVGSVAPRTVAETEVIRLAVRRREEVSYWDNEPLGLAHMQAAVTAGGQAGKPSAFDVPAWSGSAPPSPERTPVRGSEQVPVRGQGQPAGGIAAAVGRVFSRVVGHGR